MSDLTFSVLARLPTSQDDTYVTANDPNRQAKRMAFDGALLPFKH